MNEKQEKPICPNCKESSSVVRIQYGKPGPQLLEAAKRGEVKLGGCSVEGFKHFCKTCELKFK